MRVIAGTLKGRRLNAPTWEGLRPRPTSCARRCSTSSRQRVVGARVIDGYAGTGAIGIEALSRGAAARDVRRVGPPCADAHRREPAVVRNRDRLYYGPLNGGARLVDARGRPGIRAVRPHPARPAVRPTGGRDAGRRRPFARAGWGGSCSNMRDGPSCPTTQDASTACAI